EKGDVSDWLESGGTLEELNLLRKKAPPLDLDLLDQLESDWFPDPVDVKERWPDPLPLPERESVPNLSLEYLPGVLQPWLEQIADETSIPIELAAAPAIVGIASVVAAKFKIRPWRNSGYTVVPNCYGAIIARPGAMKSSTIKEALKPVFELASIARDKHKQEC